MVPERVIIQHAIQQHGTYIIRPIKCESRKSIPTSEQMQTHREESKTITGCTGARPDFPSPWGSGCDYHGQDGSHQFHVVGAPLEGEQRVRLLPALVTEYVSEKRPSWLEKS